MDSHFSRIVSPLAAHPHGGLFVVILLVTVARLWSFLLHFFPFVHVYAPGNAGPLLESAFAVPLNVVSRRALDPISLTHLNHSIRKIIIVFRGDMKNLLRFLSLF